MSSVTVKQLIDAARLRHWSFTDTSIGDGAVIVDVNQRQRRLMGKYRDAIRGIVDVTYQQAAVVNGALIGLDTSGNPTTVTTFQDGWAVQVSSTGIPYIDTSLPKVAGDPFGASGGTAGWPLPTDWLALLSLSAGYQDGSDGAITMIDEAIRHAGPQGRNPTVFITGNRLVPLRKAPVGGAPDVWASVTSVMLRYIPLPVLTALTDTFTMPAAMEEPLIAGIASLLAIQSAKCDKADKQYFASVAVEAEKSMSIQGFDLLSDFQSENVVYEGD